MIGAVLLKAEKAPHLITEAMVKEMKPGSVIIDASIDQGGCVETSRPTTIDDPVFVSHGVVHYSCTQYAPAVGGVHVDDRADECAAAIHSGSG